VPTQIVLLLIVKERFGKQPAAQGNYQTMTLPINFFLLQLSEDPLKREANNTRLNFYVNTLNEILLIIISSSSCFTNKLVKSPTLYRCS
jgi:hypothetical protein